MFEDYSPFSKVVHEFVPCRGKYWERCSCTRFPIFFSKEPWSKAIKSWFSVWTRDFWLIPGVRQNHDYIEATLETSDILLILNSDISTQLGMYRPKNQCISKSMCKDCSGQPSLIVNQPTSARKLIKSTEFMDSFAKEFKASTHPHDAKAWDKPR